MSTLINNIGSLLTTGNNDSTIVWI